MKKFDAEELIKKNIMITISCKNGRIFSGINEDYMGAEEEYITITKDEYYGALAKV